MIGRRTFEEGETGERRTSFSGGLSFNPFRSPTATGDLWDAIADDLDILESFNRRSFRPLFDGCETADSYVIKADLPGVRAGDVEVDIGENRVIVRGKRLEPSQGDDDRYFCRERPTGTFVRAFRLPDGCDADHVRGELKDGILTVTVAKRPEAQLRRVALIAAPGSGNGGTYESEAVPPSHS